MLCGQDRLGNMDGPSEERDRRPSRQPFPPFLLREIVINPPTLARMGHMCPKVCLALGIPFYAKGYFFCRTSRPFFLPSTPDLSHPKKVYAYTSVPPHGNGAIGFFEVRRNMGIFTLKASFTLVVILMPLEIFLKNQTAIF